MALGVGIEPTNAALQVQSCPIEASQYFSSNIILDCLIYTNWFPVCVPLRTSPIDAISRCFWRDRKLTRKMVAFKLVEHARRLTSVTDLCADSAGLSLPRSFATCTEVHRILCSNWLRRNCLSGNQTHNCEVKVRRDLITIKTLYCWAIVPERGVRGVAPRVLQDSDIFTTRHCPSFDIVLVFLSFFKDHFAVARFVIERPCVTRAR